MKKKIQFIIIQITIVLFGLLLLEMATRVIFPSIKSSSISGDIFEDNKYNNSPGLKPGGKGFTNSTSIEIDEFGFRKTEIPIDTSKKSWLLLGDSVTMGIGVNSDSTFHAILQRYFKSINILNPSLIGYDVNDYSNVLDYFVNHQKSLEINRVTICWCLNDIYLNIEDVETPGGSTRYLFGSVLTYLKTKSRFYSLLKSVFFDRPKSYYLFDSSIYDEDKPNLKIISKKLNELKQLCELKNIQMDIVILPYEYQFRKLNFSKESPQKRFKKVIKGITTLDFGIDTIKVKDSSKYYLFSDGIHFSEFGHRWIAAKLIDFYKTK